MKELTQQELIKVFSAYLPYNVKFVDFVDNTESILDVDNISEVLNDYENIGTIKLHLWDLSMLTKEIEHEGETFVPQDKLSHLDLEWLINSDNLIMKTNYEYVLKLLEWHFNIFNLDESQYINKATLKTK